MLLGSGLNIREDGVLATQQCPVCGEWIDDLSTEFCPICGETITPDDGAT
jgi:rubrerythrin